MGNKNIVNEKIEELVKEGNFIEFDDYCKKKCK